MHVQMQYAHAVVLALPAHAAFALVGSRRTRPMMEDRLTWAMCERLGAPAREANLSVFVISRETRSQEASSDSTDKATGRKHRQGL
jgi:hypothetical protein